MEAASANASAKARPRRGVVMALIVFASILGFVSVFSIWANRQLLETDNWVNTSSQLLEDEAIRTELSNFMVDQLYANVDVQGDLKQALPPDLQGLAGPAAGGIRQLVDQLANELLQRPRVQQAWEDINRATQETFVKVVEDSSDQPVTLDLGTIIDQLGSQAGIDVANKIPPDAGQIEVVPPDKLSTAKDIVNLIKKLAIWLTLAALLLFALAIYLARGWRREALRAVGFSFILIGIAVIVARRVAGNYVVDSLASTASVKPAVSDAYDISTSLLSDGGGAMIFYGILVVLGAWLAGPGGIATSVRRTITPVLEQRAIGYGALLAILLLLFWWSPTEGFQRLPIALLIIALFIAGFEALRRIAIREFPDETWEKGSERWRNAGRSLLERRKT